MSNYLQNISSDQSVSTRSTIHVLGHNLVEDLMGHVDLGTMGFLELTGRLPSTHEAALFNALVVSLVEHGLTPSALATRLTTFGAPENLQSAVAAGLLGLGSTFVGSMEGTAKYVHLSDRSLEPGDAGCVIADDFLQRRQPIPGIGHNIHRPTDPRVTRLFGMAEELGIGQWERQVVLAVAARASEIKQRELPLNVTGAIGALACALGIDWRVTRGIGVMARAVGLVGHVREEMSTPVAPTIWRDVDTATGGRRLNETPT